MALKHQCRSTRGVLSSEWSRRSSGPPDQPLVLASVGVRTAPLTPARKCGFVVVLGDAAVAEFAAGCVAECEELRRSVLEMVIEDFAGPAVLGYSGGVSVPLGHVIRRCSMLP